MHNSVFCNFNKSSAWKCNVLKMQSLSLVLESCTLNESTLLGCYLIMTDWDFIELLKYYVKVAGKGAAVIV